MNEMDMFAAGKGEPIFRQGETFLGYVVERLLGKGGLGTVWLVRHQVLDTLFALKVLDPVVAEEQPEYVKIRARSQVGHQDTPSQPRVGP